MREVPLYPPTRGVYRTWHLHGRCRANMAHIKQSRPDAGLGFQVMVLETFEFVPSSFLAYTMYYLNGFRKSIPPPNCQLMFTFTD